MERMDTVEAIVYTYDYVSDPVRNTLVKITELFVPDYKFTAHYVPPLTTENRVLNLSYASEAKRIYSPTSDRQNELIKNHIRCTVSQEWAKMCATSLDFWQKSKLIEIECARTAPQILLNN